MNPLLCGVQLVYRIDLGRSVQFCGTQFIVLHNASAVALAIPQARNFDQVLGHLQI